MESAPLISLTPLTLLSLLIFFLLVVATTVVKVRIRSNGSEEDDLNLDRIRTWWFICVIGITVFYFSSWVLTVFVIFLTYWAIFEFSRAQKIMILPFHFLFITGAILFYAMLIKNLEGFEVVFFVLPVIFLAYALRAATSGYAKYISMLLFCISSIHTFELMSNLESHYTINNGSLLLFICFITAVNDIAQYVCGKKFGANQLAPNLSPNKTIEGAIGGVLITSSIAMLVLSNMIDMTWFFAFSIGILISIFGTIGDLTFSYFKRLSQVKDYGTSLPGHGGLLDRIDSLMLTVPIFGLCLKLLN